MGRPTRNLQAWLEVDLRARLDRLTRRRAPTLPPPQVLISAPGSTFAYGQVEQAFHTASIGKVFTAALVGVMVEQGRIALDDPVGRYIPAAELDALPAAREVDFGAQVTIEQLLSHRSGLPDPLLPPRGHHTECSVRALVAAPDRRWTHREIVAQTRGLPPVGRPSHTFRYSDGGYALLLRLLEEATGASSAELLTQFVFAPSGMTHTHQPHDTATASELQELDIAPMMVAGQDLSRSPVLSFGSADGGAVSTLADLECFQRALHGGALISHDLLAHLARPRSRLRPGIHYGAGLATLRFGGFMPVVLRNLPEPVGGLGLTATHAFYYPDQDAHVILNFHSTAAMNSSFQVHIPVARQLGRLL